ncbi:MAG: nucleoside deaminase [Candidatus Bathyarchaeia archaeon]|jgi:cytosine deaminase
MEHIEDRKAHQGFMKVAIEEAKLGMHEGGVPIGSVLVRNGKIIGQGHNRHIQERDPTSHAEIDCLRKAGRIGSYSDTTIYSTLMPCYLCSGAVVQFGISKVVVGESATFPGGEELMVSHGVQVINLNLDECKEIMKQFIEKYPKLWDEDIGKL